MTEHSALHLAHGPRRSRARSGLSAAAMLALVTGLVTGLVACGSADPAVVATTTTGSTPQATTTSSPTSTSESPQAADERLAGQAVVRFVATTDRLAIDPKSSLDDIYTVARDSSAFNWTQILAAERAKQERQIGITPVTLGSISATSATSFSVSACLDVSKTNVVDAAGKSVVPADRSAGYRFEYTVSKTAQGFFVVKDQVIETC